MVYIISYFVLYEPFAMKNMTFCHYWARGVITILRRLIENWNSSTFMFGMLKIPLSHALQKLCNQINWRTDVPSGRRRGLMRWVLFQGWVHFSAKLANGRKVLALGFRNYENGIWPRSCKRREILFQKSLLLFSTWREYFYSLPTHFSSQPKK